MPQRKKVTFTGSSGQDLAGLIELPDTTPKAIALFAHCFTCGKDIAASSRVARHMVDNGFGVLRFDFTGLGNSDGDFANTNFTSNVSDLLHAAEFLRNEYQAPQILIGHSLGGTAVLHAANQIPESRGIVTIGSPANASHVSHNFQESLREIEDKGEAEVNLGGRKFRILKQFVDDIRNTKINDLSLLKKACLIMHAPFDEIVSIREAEKIYQSASHPKSFVSLDDADHLLSRKSDAEYVADVIASWSARFLAQSDESKPASNKSEHDSTMSDNGKVAPGVVKAEEIDHKFAISLTTDRHSWRADEPVSVGGADTGPDPYDLLLSSVGACTVMTVRMYAERKGWPLDDIEVSLKHQRRYDKDCEECEDKPRQIDEISRQIRFKGDLTSEQKKRLMEIADKCPVHRTLTCNLEITSELV